MAAATKYDVGGVLLDRPFKIRRLGHFGYYAADQYAAVNFYTRLLGFRVSDDDGINVFLRYGSDHHALVIGDRQKGAARMQSGAGAHHYRHENDINQITWQVQSRRELVEATQYFKDIEVEVIREGRGGAGSNFHLYLYDPDDQIDELYYGIEQIGWDGHAKPAQMRHGERFATPEPHVPEYTEINGDLAQGIDMMAGVRYEEELPATYDVDGVLLPRPFKITRIGPVKIFVDSVESSTAFYVENMGFTLTETVEWQGERAAFLRCGMEHHSLALFPRHWRSQLGLKPDSSGVSLGLQVANYRQLRDAVAFLRENGVRVETTTLPSELHPGVDYAAYAFDLDGHALELYYYMEQVGWEGQARPRDLQRAVDPNNWPVALEPLADTYAGEPFLGPWA